MNAFARAALAAVLSSATSTTFAMFATIAETSAPFFVSGNELYAMRGDAASAQMFVAGVIDGNARLTINDSDRRYCLPRGATLQQLTDIAMMSLEKSPATRHEPAAYLVRFALQVSFSCPAK